MVRTDGYLNPQKDEYKPFVSKKYYVILFFKDRQSKSVFLFSANQEIRFLGLMVTEVFTSDSRFV